MMRTPRRYRTLLRIRKREEDLAAMALGETDRSLLRARDELLQLREAHRQILERASEAHAAPQAGSLDNFSRYERHLTRLVSEKDREIVEWTEKRTERKAIYDVRNQQRRMIDTLIDRVRSTQARALQQAEAREVDETGTQLVWARKRKAAR